MMIAVWKDVSFLCWVFSVPVQGDLHTSVAYSKNVTVSLKPLRLYWQHLMDICWGCHFAKQSKCDLWVLDMCM